MKDQKVEASKKKQESVIQKRSKPTPMAEQKGPNGPTENQGEKKRGQKTLVNEFALFFACV